MATTVIRRYNSNILILLLILLKDMDILMDMQTHVSMSM
jgi:hypothetical protein